MSSWDLIAIAAVLLLGVPHGGLDGAIARRIGWPSGALYWLGFHLAYVGLAALVSLLWWLFPLPSLALFLLISGLHFGASDIAGTGSHWLPWVAHGGLVCIGIPSLQAASVEPLFALLTEAQSASLLMQAIGACSLLWAISLIGYLGYAYFHPRYRKPLVKLLILLGLVVILPPLVSFAVYFCLWHSRGHMLRLWQGLDSTERSRSVAEAAIYSAMAWVSAAIIFYYLQSSVAVSLVQLTFIGLAALTLPHMVLVDYADRKNNKNEALL
jgi:Brp/Blh family beta-carotene 15,15'-monooxygenase